MPIPRPPRLLPGYKANFKTLLKAAKNSDLALVSAIRKADNAPVALVCAVQAGKPPEETRLIPLAVLCEGNPFDDFIDPTVVPIADT